MKTLTQSIKNCINIINFIYEELDDNLLYLVDMWLEHHEEEMQEFIDEKLSRLRGTSKK